MLNAVISPSFEQFFEYHKGAFTMEVVLAGVFDALRTNLDEISASNHRRDKTEKRAITWVFVNRLCGMNSFRFAKVLGIHHSLLVRDVRVFNDLIDVEDESFMRKVECSFYKILHPEFS